MTMRERMARAMVDAFSVGLRPPKFDDLAEFAQYSFLKAADAVLDAMDEPSEAMNEAAKPFRKGVGEGVGAMWAALITAAKEER